MAALAFPFAFILALLATHPAHAQLARHLTGRRVIAVHVEGETSGATGASDIGIEIGSVLDRALLRATVERLLATDRWADIQIDARPNGEGVELFVHLRPRLVITRVDVMGNEALSDDEVRAVIGLGPGGALEDDALAALEDTIRATYADRGYDAAEVRWTLRDTDDPSRKVLHVVVVEGEPSRLFGFVYPEESPPAGFDLPDGLGLHEGDVLDRTRLRDGVETVERRLHEGGWLEAHVGEPRVLAQGGQASLVIPLRVGPHYDVRIIGHEPLTRGTVEEALELTHARLTTRVYADLPERVQTLYQRHGYYQAQAGISRFAGPQPNTAVLEIRITPGNQLHVVGMSFPGASHFSSDYLRSQVVSVLEEDLPDTRLFAAVDSDTVDRVGLGGQSLDRRRRIPRPVEVDPSRVYYEPLYEAALEHVRDVYESVGYLSARAGPVRFDRVGRGRAVIVLPIFEGPRTQLYAVRLTGNRVIGDRELLEAAGLSRDEPFSYLGLEEAVTRMTQLYQERGYLYARIEPDVRFSEDRERAEVVLTVVERFEVRVGEITIEGNERTDAGLIRDVLQLSTGDVYRPSLVHGSQEALLALGVFSSVNISPRDPTLAERVKPLIVRVSERMPQYFDYQLGISTGQGLRTSLEYGYRNGAGYAFSVTGRAQLGFQFIFQDQELQDNISNLPVLDRLERRITITLALPHLPGIDNVRSTLDLVHVRDNQRAFGVDDNGVVLSFNWRPVSRLSLTLSAELENNNVQLFGDRTSIRQVLEENPGNTQITQLLRVPQGNSVVVSSRLTTAYDARDNSFVPTDGWFASGTVEWAHTLSTEAQEDGEPFFSHFLKLSATLNGYTHVDEVVFAGQFRIGGVIPLEPTSETYPNRQFFLGGVDTLRGFNQDQLQPQDIAELQLADPLARTGTVLQGGDFFYLLRFELRFPIFESLHGAVFTDVGNHWARTENVLSTMCPAMVSQEACFPIRPTAGLGIRIATPVGPLALDYGFNLLRREELNEPIGAFHFSIGVF
ncbi:MAG: POTRA domain-containing protein [Sandaracinaceae bacterium]